MMDTPPELVNCGDCVQAHGDGCDAESPSADEICPKVCEEFSLSPLARIATVMEAAKLSELAGKGGSVNFNFPDGFLESLRMLVDSLENPPAVPVRLGINKILPNLTADEKVRIAEERKA